MLGGRLIVFSHPSQYICHILHHWMCESKMELHCESKLNFTGMCIRFFKLSRRADHWCGARGEEFGKNLGEKDIWEREAGELSDNNCNNLLYKRSLEGLTRKFHMQENVNSGVNKKRPKIQIPNSLFTVESALSSQASSQALLFLEQTLINRLRIPTGRR